MKNRKTEGLGFLSVVAVGIGGMIGGGIFAVLGLAVELAGGATPIAFIFAGIIALITSYSYAKLSVTFPSQGGTVTFLNRAFGTGIFTGGLNIMLWLSYVIMLSLYAYAFGSYASTFFPSHPIYKHMMISVAIALFMFLNLLGSRAVGESEELIVAFKVGILLFFIGVGFWSINSERLLTNWAPPLKLIAGGMIIFLAYEGFELIANTAGDVHDVKKLPLAYYTAVGFVILIYVLVATVTVGNLPLNQIISARDYALAEAAKPFLGEAGFLLIVIAALLSTSSAINATLYGAARVSYIIAKEGELPEVLERKVWNRPAEGLLITGFAALITANTLNLSGISTAGSAGFLLIFAAVNAANLKLHVKTSSNRVVPMIGIITCCTALAVLLTESKSLEGVTTFIFILTASFLIEYAYRKVSGREIVCR